MRFENYKNIVLCSYLISDEKYDECKIKFTNCGASVILKTFYIIIYGTLLIFFNFVKYYIQIIYCGVPI